ncbi:hypothetical protein ARMSODRAFT_442848 [Armillaria solidipes]|uniref:Uncharacterized protein n=1 Tax=Armillaria solidipes TaxID=1076256 RepID=A0A2H3BEC1_9AGAR|nr:hypothetical protein ARMSODRAFT_442848 [Armillaria solidipes]
MGVVRMPRGKTSRSYWGFAGAASIFGTSGNGTVEKRQDERSRGEEIEECSAIAAESLGLRVSGHVQRRIRLFFSSGSCKSIELVEGDSGSNGYALI